MDNLQIVNVLLQVLIRICIGSASTTALIVIALLAVDLRASGIAIAIATFATLATLILIFVGWLSLFRAAARLHR